MKNQHANESITTETSTQTRSDQAFHFFRQAFEEGYTAGFLSLVTDDFRFRVPLPLRDWETEQHGKQRFDELVRFERKVLQVRLTPLIELDGTNHGMVVFRAEGTLNDLPYRNELVVVFEYEGGKIQSFHEFVGMPLKNYES